MNTSEVETPRNDASYGTLLLGKPDGNFSYISNSQINLWANGDIKNARLITIAGKRAVIIAKNNDSVSILSLPHLSP